MFCFLAKYEPYLDLIKQLYLTITVWGCLTINVQISLAATAGGGPCRNELELLTLPAQVWRLSNGEVYFFRSALESDVFIVNKVIKRAFRLWTRQAVRVSSARQSVEATRYHLITAGKGFVITEPSGEIIGTVSLNLASITETYPFLLNYKENGYEPVLYDSLNAQTALSRYRSKFDGTKRFLVLKKLAIATEKEKRGLGFIIFKMIYNLACEKSFDGILIETVAEARAVYRWYRSLRFYVIGDCQYPGSELATLLMLKEIK